MNLLLHPIIVGPSRWQPEQVHRPLAELLSAVTGAGFGPLELWQRR